MDPAIQTCITILVSPSVRGTGRLKDYQQQLFEAEVIKDCNRMRNLFDLLDADEDGEVTREEFCTLGRDQISLKELGQTLEVTMEELFDATPHPSQ